MRGHLQIRQRAAVPVKGCSPLAETRNLLLELVGAVRDSEKETFERVVSGTGVSKVLRLLPPLPHDRVPEWLKSLDLFVLPSLTEGCPNILMEAMAAGVPVVATRTGATEELVKHKVSGLLVPRGDSTSLAAAMGKIMDDDGLAESLAAAGRKRMQRFDTNRERKAWEALYRELLDF